MNIGIIGCLGTMGKHMMDLGAKEGHLMFGIDPRGRAKYSFESSLDLDVLIDFSHADVLAQSLSYANKHQTPLVIASTGLSVLQEESIVSLSKNLPIFVSANFSLGIYRLKKLIQYAQQISVNASLEIIDVHHIHKKDAPSGTAKELLKVLGKDIPIHSFREGEVVGEHTVLFRFENESIELKHSAHSKLIFAQGALKAAQFLTLQKPGYYSMDDLFKGDTP